MRKILSISVASYNVENTLKETVDSMLKCENVKELEIIIVNDGSKDKTLKIAENYKKVHPGSIVVVDKKNGGHGSTINAALDVATGKYFKTVDGDDWVDSTELDKLIVSLRTCEADLVTSDFSLCLENSGEKVLRHNGIDYAGKTINIDDILNKRAFQMHEISIRTDLLKDSNCRILENCFYVDREYMQYCVGLSETVCEYDYNVYQYRVGDINQSVSPQSRVKRINDQKKLLIRLLEWEEKCPIKSHKQYLQKDTLQFIDYIIESYSFFDLQRCSQVKYELVQLFANIQKNYSYVDLNKKYISFWNYNNASIKSKIFYTIRYLVICSNFKGFSLVMLMQKIRRKDW